jgi:acyl dehydratase
MSTLVKLSQVAVGDELPNLTMNFTRADLVKYAGASGDFNIIHWHERTAKEVGLPDVISHGMLTMARAAKVVTDWVGDPGAVLEYSVRMTRPVVVPDTDAGVEVTFGGKVGAINEDGTVRIDVSAVFDGQTVLGAAKAVVRLDA